MMGTQKAWAAGVVGFLTVFLSTVAGAMTTADTFAQVPQVTWLWAVINGLGALGISGGVTWRVENRPVRSGGG